MSKYLYRNDTKTDLVIIGVGVVKVGESLEADLPIENPNLTVVDTKAVKSKQPVNKEPGDVE